MSTDLPAEVRLFIDGRIESVPHLETLLILFETASSWDAKRMSGRIYVGESATQAILQDLQRAGLAASEDGVQFSYDGRWDEGQSLMPRVVLTYQRNVARIANLIHGRPSSSVRAFARAFDFKKEQ